MSLNQVNINWKRVLFYVLLFSILLFVIYSIFLYRSIMVSKTAGFQEATSFIIEETDIIETNDITYFQADLGYYIVRGITSKNEQVYAYLEDTDPFSTNKLYVIDTNHLLTKEQLEQSVTESCASCQLIHSTPAMIEQFPLWELTYIDESERYVIEYKYLETGQTFETLKLTRK